jgi:hypothetical protein
MPDTGISPDIDSLIVATVGKYRLPPEIVRAMVVQESTDNTCAIRFEQGFYDRYLKGKTPNFRPEGCSWNTERVGRAVSWGLLQVMGETARCNGFRGWFPELCQPAVGLEWGCLYLSRLRDRFLAKGGWEVVVRAYNGGSGNAFNTANTYPAEVLARIPGGVWPATEVSHA